jgi:formylglycine-generating enzyme required for sulfatase activity
MVLLLTPAAAASPWVEMETNVAIELERSGEMIFIPLLLEKGRYPGLWRAYQWVMGDGRYDFALTALRERLTGKKQASEADSPGELVINSQQREQIVALVKEISQKLSEKSGQNESGKVYGELYRKFSITDYKLLPPSRFNDIMAYLTVWRDEIIKTIWRGEAVSSITPERRVHEKTGIELIRIPAGPFLYGKDLRKIELPEFWIGRYPVTNAQYKRFLDANPRHRVPYYDVDWAKPFNWDQKRRAYPSNKADHPVLLVSWDNAKAFCDWAGLALPTEEQWEKAARGTNGRDWPWGNEWAENRANSSEAGIRGTTPVGKYSPQGDSPYGCADMAGNVWEWTDSWYDDSRRGRVLRGGSWFYDLRFARVSIRLNYTPGNAIFNIGFRVAAPVDSGF